MTSNELIKKGSNFLKKNKIKSHIIDTEILLSSISGETREKFLLKSNLKMSQKQIKSFNNLITRRALKKEPVAYLINKKEFWSMNFNVCKDVLIPRPETEILVETLAKYFKGHNPFILDIGTGSGCIIISLLQELKNSKGVAIDISNKALKIAKKNSRIYNTSKRKLQPVALNSVLFWQKGLKIIKKGHIIIEFLPQIDIGLDKKEVLEKVENSIESATNKLLN